MISSMTFSKQFFAALTASLMSSSCASCTCAISFAVAGLIAGNVLPLFARWNSLL